MWKAIPAFCAALLLLGAPWPARAAEAKPLTAILLVARSELGDPNFADSVVLVMNNLGPAPVGVVINRPTHIPVADLFPELRQLAQLHDKVYFGGPVGLETVWFLFRGATRPAHAVPACDGVYLSGDRELLLKLLARRKPMDGLRIFVGHAGWAPGQLEAEIGAGAWTLERAAADAIFSGKAQHPWPAAEGPKDST